MPRHASRTRTKRLLLKDTFCPGWVSLGKTLCQVYWYNDNTEHEHGIFLISELEKKMAQPRMNTNVVAPASSSSQPLTTKQVGNRLLVEAVGRCAVCVDAPFDATICV